MVSNQGNIDEAAHENAQNIDRQLLVTVGAMHPVKHPFN
jgi:hypothetical protein